MNKDNILNWAGVAAVLGAGVWFWNPIKQTESTTYTRTDNFAETRAREAGDMDCSDFDYQSEAQEFFEEEGGPSKDYHNLDRDGDGEVCETLP